VERPTGNATRATIIPIPVCGKGIVVPAHRILILKKLLGISIGDKPLVGCSFNIAVVELPFR
jgi:hypothetical protein